MKEFVNKTRTAIRFEQGGKEICMQPGVTIQLEETPIILMYVATNRIEEVKPTNKKQDGISSRSKNNAG